MEAFRDNAKASDNIYYVLPLTNPARFNEVKSIRMVAAKTSDSHLIPVKFALLFRYFNLGAQNLP